ncbi:MAG TPA: hypothetical protein VGD69_05435 [Herpetosiphonaceae bacterium]
MDMVADNTRLAGQSNTSWTVEHLGQGSSPSAVFLAKDGGAFFAKGVAYSPVPIGGSFHYTPQVGDWFHGPWTIIAARDMPMMRALGLNFVRTYAFWWWQVTTDLQVMRTLDQSSPITTTGTEPFDERTGFFSALEENGVYSLIGVALDGGNVFDGGSDAVRFAYGNFYLQTAEKLAREYGDEPSVMGFCLANEQNQAARNTRADVWAYYFLMKQRVQRGLGSNKKLVSIAWQNDADLYNGTHTVDLSDANIATLPAANGSGDTEIDLQQAARDLRAALVGGPPADLTTVPVEQIISTICDVWGLNIYAGMGDSLQHFDAHVFQTPYARPLLVTEWGHAGTENHPASAVGPIAGNAGLVEQDSTGMKTAADGIDSDIAAMQGYLKFVSGGTYFEWTDEWWKNDSFWDAIPQSQQDYLNEQISAWKPGAPPPTYQLDAAGKITFNSGQTGYPQYTFVWDGSANQAWPEEGWGLQSVAPNGRQAWDNPWNVSANQPYPADVLIERTMLLDALLGRAGAYVNKGYPMLETAYEQLMNS